MANFLGGPSFSAFLSIANGTLGLLHNPRQFGW